MIRNIKETIKIVLRALFMLIDLIIDFINYAYGTKISHLPKFSDFVYEKVER